MSIFQPGITVEKNSSTIGPPAGIEPTPHRTGVGSLPAGGPIVDEFFSTVPGWNIDMCIISTRYIIVDFNSLSLKCSELRFEIRKFVAKFKYSQ